MFRFPTPVLALVVDQGTHPPLRVFGLCLRHIWSVPWSILGQTNDVCLSRESFVCHGDEQNETHSAALRSSDPGFSCAEQVMFHLSHSSHSSQVDLTSSSGVSFRRSFACALKVTWSGIVPRFGSICESGWVTTLAGCGLCSGCLEEDLDHVQPIIRTRPQFLDQSLFRLQSGFIFHNWPHQWSSVSV